MLSRWLFAPTHWSVLCSHGAADRPAWPELFHGTSRDRATQPFDAHRARSGPSWISPRCPSGRWKAVTPDPWPVVPPGEAHSPSCPGPTHRKWFSTVSFVTWLGSPVTNRVRLTYRKNIPERNVTRTSQSVGRPRFSTQFQPPLHPRPSKNINGNSAGSKAVLCGLAEP